MSIKSLNLDFSIKELCPFEIMKEEVFCNNYRKKCKKECIIIKTCNFSESSVSESSVSENSVSENSVSENSVSENSVSNSNGFNKFYNVKLPEKEPVKVKPNYFYNNSLSKPNIKFIF